MMHKIEELIEEKIRPAELVLRWGTQSGAEFRFRIPRSYSDLRKLVREANEFANLCRPSACHPDWESYLPTEYQAAVEIGYLQALCDGWRMVDSSDWEPVSQLDWLKLAHHCGLELGMLYAQLLEHLNLSVAQGEQEAAEALGESCNEMVCSEHT